MKNKLPLLLLSVVLPCAAQAQFYLEPRLAYQHVSGTPNIGDIGKVLESDEPAVAPGIALGYALSPRLRLEVRYVSLGNLVVAKLSPNYQIFPVTGPLLPVLRKYEYAQRTDLFAAALPVQVFSSGRASLRLAPLLQLESADVTLTDIIDIMSAQPNVLSLPYRTVYLHRTTTEVHAAAEVSFDYSISDRTTFVLHYTYSPLSNFDAHLFGVGLGVKF